MTFFCHGTGPWDFVECNFVNGPHAKYYLKTDNDAAKGYMTLAGFLSNIPGLNQTFIGTMDEKGNLLPVTHGAAYRE